MLYANYMREKTKNLLKYAEAEGNPITITNALDRPIRDVRLFGESVQEGTPTPDSPVDIVSVENPTIEVCGKNLFDIEKVDNVGNGNNQYRKNGDEISTAYPTSYNFLFVSYSGDSLMLRAGTYTLSCDLKVENPTDDYKTVNVGVRNYDTKQYLCNSSFKLNALGIWEHYSVTVTLTEAARVQLKFQPYSPPNPSQYKCRVYARNIQLERNDVATEYEPYTEQSVTLDGITLRGVSPLGSHQAYADEIAVDGKQKTVKHIQRAYYWNSLNYTGVWSTYGKNEDANIVRYNAAIGKPNWVYGNALCTHFKLAKGGVTTNNFWEFSSADYSARVYFKVPIDQYPTANDFKAFMANNEIELICKLDEPIETDITNTEAGKALLGLYTNKGVSIISLSSASNQGEVKIKYVRK